MLRSSDIFRLSVFTKSKKKKNGSWGHSALYVTPHINNEEWSTATPCGHYILQLSRRGYRQPEHEINAETSHSTDLTPSLSFQGSTLRTLLKPRSPTRQWILLLTTT